MNVIGHYGISMKSKTVYFPAYMQMIDKKIRAKVTLANVAFVFPEIRVPLIRHRGDKIRGAGYVRPFLGISMAVHVYNTNGRAFS